MVFVEDRPDFDWTQFDYAQRPDNLDEFRMIVDAVDPDLSAFKASGGKLLSYFGWADPDINPLTLIDYREAVAQLDPDVDAMYLADWLLQARPGTTSRLGPLEYSALAETGNVVLSSFLNALAQFSNSSLQPSPPTVMVDSPAALLEVALASITEGSSTPSLSAIAATSS